MKFMLPDPWKRRLFLALCRRYGLEPYRYARQRHTTLLVKVPRSFVDKTPWREYLQICEVLNEYLSEVTARISGVVRVARPLAAYGEIQDQKERMVESPRSPGVH